MTPRYKQNPFGSNISRFDPMKKSGNHPTEEEKRVKELVQDLEEHTSLRPAVTGKPLHAPLMQNAQNLDLELVQEMQNES